MEYDLNLLRVLAALAQTRRVTAAAELLGMTQPGVSNALRRLRVAYDDPLFVRTASGMEPTSRAVPLIDGAREILELYAARMGPHPEFSPRSSETEFCFALSDIGEMVFLPRILQHLRTHAPRATVRSVSLAPDALARALEEGSVDLALGYFPDLRGAGFFQQKLFSHGFVCLVRSDHPVADKRLTARRFLGLEHAVVQAEGRSQEVFEQFLRRKRIQRRVVLHVPHFMSIPMVIARSDLIVTVPLAVGTAFASTGQLRLVDPPFTLPRFDLKQHWHRRVHKDARHRWLRAQIALLFNENTDEWRLLLKSRASERNPVFVVDEERESARERRRKEAFQAR